MMAGSEDEGREEWRNHGASPPSGTQCDFSTDMP